MKKNSGGSTSGSVKKQLKKKKSEKEVNSVSSITDIDLSSAVQGQYSGRNLLNIKLKLGIFRRSQKSDLAKYFIKIY